MRFLPVTIVLIVAIMVGACDLWPKDLKPLAASISQQVSGETTAWLVGGDVVVINVASSPLYREGQATMEATATDIAEQAIAYIAAPVESIAITFHEGEVSEAPEKTSEFIFLVMENRPVLQPYLDTDATGSLTPDEIQASIERLGESLPVKQKECVLGEMAKRADDAGDPETLDPTSVEFLPADNWNELDSFGKRIILTQAITTKAFFVCASMGKGEVISE